MDWLKHAFAVNPPLPDPAPEQLQIVEQLCGEIVRRGLATPALAFLEMSRPLNYLGAQALYFWGPFLSALFAGPAHQHLAAFLERRDAIDRLCQRIEELEQQSRKKSQP